ncbi:MAG: chorismate-binding protein, partial [Paludibacteraceae bacterium]|nr:chorismate-binding protein [Paludibacteraceae bacterium]
MQNINIKVNSETYLGDLQTPVGIYLKIRDLYVESVLLESSDYNSTENSMSYVAFKPLASFVAESGEITMTYPGGEKETVSVKDKNTLPDTFQEYIKKFCVSDADKELGANGFFGYSSYEAIQYFEDIKLSAERKAENKVPEVNYVFYKYIIAFNHYKNEIKIIENLLPGETETQIPKIIGILNNPIVSEFRFELDGDEQSDITDEEFKAMVRKGKENCYKGNVFQIVLSRRFSQGSKGDDMMLYRKLRSINPSPY